MNLNFKVKNNILFTRINTFTLFIFLFIKLLQNNVDSSNLKIIYIIMQ